MIVFIDDSGDPGFKTEKGSSHYFVISLVIFNDELEAEKTAVAIKELRRQLNFPDGVEFKFSKSSNHVRQKFLETIKGFQFTIRSLVIKKDIIRSNELRTNKRSFYAYTIKLAIKNSSEKILDAKIKIDGSGDRIFRRQFLAYLRRELNTKDQRIIKSCKLVDSKDNGLIQMADMIAGAIRRSYDENKSDAKVYKQIIKKRIQDEWLFK